MRTVKDILDTKGKNVITIDITKSVYDALVLMGGNRIGSLVVTRGGDIAGVMTERDAAFKVDIKDRQSRNTSVSEIMSDRLVVVKPETNMNQCMALMTDKRVRHLPVVVNKELIGLVSIGDVVKELIDEKNFVIEQLESYIHS